MAKKKRTALPRVTVLAYSKRDLAAFAQAVETLGLLVRDLGTFVGTLKTKTTPKAKPTPPSAAVPNGSKPAAPTA